MAGILILIVFAFLACMVLNKSSQKNEQVSRVEMDAAQVEHGPVDQTASPKGIGFAGVLIGIGVIVAVVVAVPH